MLELAPPAALRCGAILKCGGVARGCVGRMGAAQGGDVDDLIRGIRHVDRQRDEESSCPVRSSPSAHRVLIGAHFFYSEAVTACVCACVYVVCVYGMYGVYCMYGVWPCALSTV